MANQNTGDAQATQNMGDAQGAGSTQQKTEGAAAGAAVGAQGSANNPPNATNAQAVQDIKAQRGGPQEDQLSGETEKGAHNNESRGANPDGNKPNQNQSGRQKGNTL